MEEEYIGWDFFERPRYERGRLWYVLMPLLGLGLLLYAVLTANFLFAFIIILFALVTYLASLGEPERVRFAVTDGGVRIGRQLLPYKDIRKFWVVYEPPHVRNLYLETGSMMQSRIAIDLDGVDPNDVRGVLGRFVREEMENVEEPLSDYLSRLLKL